MDPVLIIQNCEVETAGTIIDFLTQRRLEYAVIHSYRGDKIPDVLDFETIINLGCPCSMQNYQEHDYLKKLYEFVEEVVLFRRPYLGICFGAQMLAQAMGAQVRTNYVKEIGTYRVRLTPQGFIDSLFENFEQEFPVFQWHGETFGIPHGALLLVEGHDCKHQVFRKGNLTGVQFHLEPTPDDVSRWCDAYKEELETFGLTKEAVVSHFKENYGTIRRTNFEFLENFFNSCKY